MEGPIVLRGIISNPVAERMRAEAGKRFKAYQRALLACYQEQARTRRPPLKITTDPMWRAVLELCVWEVICDAALLHR